MSDQNLPILYSFRRCPYAMRGRLALYARGINCEIREIELKNKPDEMLNISPKGTVPVLQLIDGTVLEESLDVMLWAVSQDKNTTKIPSIQHPTDDMLALIEKIDGPFKHHLDRYKYENRYEAEGVVSSEHRDANVEILLELNERLSQSQYLFGNDISFADFAIAPFIRQFANTDRNWFDQQTFPNLINWLDSFCNSAPFLTIMKKRKPWLDTDKAFEIFP
ncbi:glutathione S-transferase [Curvivirga sp.]|uniref:glutathione S-transferase n=1 Tax=Curvivirga sp. TaxID=2856848 RepID=UPI003B5CEAD9